MNSIFDLYCERIGPGLFAEPLNAVTNVAFLIAAWGAWSLARRSQVPTVDIGILLGLSIVIATGSTLFHTFATGWARIVDELPILLFQLCYLWLYVRRVMAQRRAFAAAAIAGYLAAAYFGRQFPQLLNGSLVYAPAVILMLSLGLYHSLQRKAGPGLLLAAAGVFLISLVFRSIDETICPHLPIGTHFVWHMLNGLVLYLSMRALILSQTNRQGRAPA